MIKLAISVAMVMTVCAIASAQDVSSPLAFRISFLKELKSKHGFVVKVKITNHSSRRITIDKNFVGSRQSFYTDNGYFIASREVGATYTGSYLSLNPGQAYRDTRVIELEDEFFRTDGRFRLKLHYHYFLAADLENSVVWRGQSDSNLLTFYMKSGRLSIAQVKSPNRPKT